MFQRYQGDDTKGSVSKRTRLSTALLLLAGCTGGIAPARSESPADDGTGGGNGAGGNTQAREGENKCSPLAAELPSARIWRLSHNQYRAAVAQLIPGADLVVAKDFLRDEQLGEFDNTAKGLRISAVRAEQYERAAIALAAQGAKQVATLAPCASGQAVATCRRSFVESFATAAFRRDLTADELAALEKVYDENASPGGHAAGVAAVVETVLQAPSFLYRIELGSGAAMDGQLALSGTELASELAFGLTDAPPDKRLLDLGRSGQLLDRAVLEREARSLLASPPGRALYATFVKEWLDVAHLADVQKNEPGFTDFPATWAPRLEREIDLMVDEVLKTDRRFSTLMLSSTTFADTALAGVYGAKGAPASGHGKVTLPPEQRAGVLTTAAFLGVHAIDGASHPIKRGVFANERLLCRVPPPPPPGAGVPPAPTPNLTTRERLTRHRADPVCGSCHSFIDPPGFAFEVFDGVGRHRDSENDKPIDATGTLSIEGEADITFSGPVEFIQKVTATKAIDACFARMNHRFFLGAIEGAADGCLMQGVKNRFAAYERDVAELVVALVTSRAFTHRRAPN